MRQLSKRDKRALTLLGAVGVVILLAFAIVVPFYNAKSGVASELKDKEQLQRLVAAITPVRNDTAHCRPVPAKEFARCRIAIDDLQVLLGTRKAPA